MVSWGILFPLGIIIARYLRSFPSADPAWFYLHVSCQVSAYSIGVAGWGTGLKLGSQSKAVTYSGHRNIGIALFALATVQVTLINKYNFLSSFIGFSGGCLFSNYLYTIVIETLFQHTFVSI